MLRKSLPLLAAGALALSTACYKVDYTTSKSDSVANNADHEVWRHRLVYGIIEMDGPLQVEELCDNGEFAKIHTETDVITFLAWAGTYIATGVVGLNVVNVYTPSMIYVWCEDGTAYRATVGDNDMILALEAPVDQQVPEHLGEPAQECAEPGI
ncbi:MAG: hypothetical protein VX899_19095 [Myxococcota bacterium]|nr:hypothetical protein [Myxococcota bacterium]